MSTYRSSIALLSFALLAPLGAAAQEASQQAPTGQQVPAGQAAATGTPSAKAADGKVTPAKPAAQKAADKTQAAASQDQSPIMLDPLTVTATKEPTPRDQVPATIDVIDQEQFDLKQPLTLGDILDDLPGVEMEGGPKGSSPRGIAVRRASPGQVGAARSSSRKKRSIPPGRAEIGRAHRHRRWR